MVNTCDSVFEDRHAVKFTLFEIYGPAAPMLDEMLEATAAYLTQFH
jgi:hypothetical protein